MMATDAVMLQVRKMVAHLEKPYWMIAPEAWWWVSPSGARQTLYSPTEPGLSNLLWLVMDMDTPPHHYSAALNSMMTLVFACSPAAKLGGVSILDAAAVLPLRDFYDLLVKAPRGTNPLEETYPVLALLAKRRLNHA